jgi:hypothetical protein
MTGLHVQPRLAVGDMSARQARILLMTKNHMLRPTAPTARRVCPPGENAPPGTASLRSGYALPPSPCPRRLSHPDCRSVLTLIVARHRAFRRKAEGRYSRPSQTKSRGGARWSARQTSGPTKTVYFADNGFKTSRSAQATLPQQVDRGRRAPARWRPARPKATPRPVSTKLRKQTPRCGLRSRPGERRREATEHLHERVIQRVRR